jgi:hypothetical protein
MYLSMPESNSDCSREVYMVEQGEQAGEKNTEVIAREAEEEITREAEKGKRHNDHQDDSRSSDEEVGMALLRGDITQSLTSDAQLAESGSETGHGRSTRNSATSSTKENRSTSLQHTILWLQG